MNRKYLAIAIIVFMLFIDQWSKIWVKLNMHLGESFNVLGDWFKFYFIENPGMAFGITWGLGIGKIALSLFRLIAIIFLGIYLSGIIKRKLPYGLVVGFALIFAGATGNLIDGMFYGLIFNESTYQTVAGLTAFGAGYEGFLQGYVVDMLYFPLFSGTFPSWLPFWGGQEFLFFSPIFNIADSCVFLGVVTIVFYNKSFMADVNRNKVEPATSEVISPPIIDAPGEEEEVIN